MNKCPAPPEQTRAGRSSRRGGAPRARGELSSAQRVKGAAQPFQGKVAARSRARASSPPPWPTPHLPSRLGVGGGGGAARRKPEPRLTLDELPGSCAQAAEPRSHLPARRARVRTRSLRTPSQRVGHWRIASPAPRSPRSPSRRQDVCGVAPRLLRQSPLARSAPFFEGFLSCWLHRCDSLPFWNDGDLFGVCWICFLFGFICTARAFFSSKIHRVSAERDGYRGTECGDVLRFSERLRLGVPGDPVVVPARARGPGARSRGGRRAGGALTRQRPGQRRNQNQYGESPRQRHLPQAADLQSAEKGRGPV
nr:V-set and transmembrane domain-containing protein 2A isoform X1 [Dasypus novemcinctus]